MRDGTLRITFEGGEIRVVSVGAGLDLAYQHLFETARAELRRPNPPIEAGIRLVVFGCFWLEAACNETLRELLRISMKPPAVAGPAWDTIKRAAFHSKLSIIAAFAKSPDPGRARCVSRDLTSLFELRNRLAHFKDDDTPVAGPLTLDEFQARIDQFPNADLIVELRPPATDVYADRIVAGINWLNEIRQEYFPSESHIAEETESETR